MRIVRSASVKWAGGMKDGVGSVSTESGSLMSYPYGFGSRFEGVKGTNPEELIGAAHASCFTMALAMMLSNQNYKVEHLETQARVTLESVSEGYAITSSKLKLAARVPGLDADGLRAIAQNAKAGCPVSKALNVEIELEVVAA